MKKLEETLSLVTELHSHSIINGDKYYNDKLLQIIINLSTIGEEELSIIGSTGDNQEEIEKVKRKVPKWMKKTHQFNYKILEAYMELSNNNEVVIDVRELEEYSDIEPKIFLGHYNAMKTISKKNHAKVFEEMNKEISLWKPVAEFIVELFKGRDMTNNITEEKIGKLVQIKFKNLIENNILSNEMLNNLQNADYSKEKFNMQFPILKEISSNSDIRVERKINGYDRYYAQPIKGKYLLCNHWYESHREYFYKWCFSLPLYSKIQP